MKRIRLALFIGLTVFLSCQKEQAPVNDSPFELLTKNGNPSSKSFNGPITKEDALQIVEPITSKYPGCRIDISNEVVPAGTKIAFNAVGHKVDVDNCSYCNSPDFDAWLLVVGYDPYILSRGQKTHIFVNVESGEYTILEIGGRAIMEWDTSRNICITSDNESIKSKNSQRLPERRSGSTRWAVIISGGCDCYNNTSCFYNDCSTIYCKLTQDLDYPKGNIFCIMADGTDPAIDQQKFDCFISSDPDLDGDGTNDIQYSASRANIASVFDQLSLLVSPGDEVLVFVTDHGDQNGLCYLWGNETLSPYQLNAELNKLGPSVMIDVVMGQCYSGAFVGPLTAANRTITTACSSSEEAWIYTYQYNIFLNHWINFISTSCATGDGYVSPHELFIHARANTYPQWPQQPQYSSTPSDFGDVHSLMGESIPYILGSDYLSTNANSLYSIVNYPNPTSVTWSVGNNVYLLSSTDSTAVLRGIITDSDRYFAETGGVSATIVVDGVSHRLAKFINSVWKPGSYIDKDNIWGSNGLYHVRSLGGEYGYQWAVDNPAWQITGWSGYYVNVLEGFTTSPVNLLVWFYDPLGELIMVRDRIK